jgi:hypothetical protein
MIPYCHSCSCAGVMAVLLGIILAGCQGKIDGPMRYHVSGEVTYEGKPLPYGQIRFVPDTSAGNSGPAGFSEIIDGRYDTRLTGKGTVGGPHTVVIDGCKSRPRPEEDGDDIEKIKARTLFTDFKTTLDLPKQNATENIDVPKL